MERFKNIPLHEITSRVVAIGEQKFRAQQIVSWVYDKRVNTFDEMRNISGELKEKLKQNFVLAKLKVNTVIESKFGDAVKFGFETVEGDYIIESVLLIDGDRRTICLSSQLGCGLGCVFCETGKMGLIRNLTQEEIVGQFIGVNDYLASKGDKSVTNIVFMGMGEALSNFDAFLKSLAIFMNEDIYNIGGRRITVSTAGVVPSVERLLKEKLNIGLAISLNSYSNELRDRLMPINKKYPIESVVAIARRYSAETGRTVTFEYVVIDGKTNTPEALQAIQKYCGGLDCKINLIPLNPSTGSTLSVPEDAGLEKFAEALERKGITVTIRKSRGQDIWGACGQLAGKRISE
jgi:23S rRNA (adenine2503-C2)-methyltransferase